jgi:preprotein translocase subunit SecA
MNRFLRMLFPRPDADAAAILRINRLREEMASLTEPELRRRYQSSPLIEEVIAVAAVAAHRVLGERMFDVQLRGALALARGSIAEMQTGEGKTLTAVPAALWLARGGQGVHVMTVNDYLATRDAEWMGPIYRMLGVSCGSVRQGLTPGERRAAYACDITYATANEVGFDYLRDQLVLHPQDRVHRPFASALVDEADSILIDEARIPLVIAGGDEGEDLLAIRADRIVRGLARGTHFRIEEHFRNVTLTDTGIHLVEQQLACGNLFAAENLNALAAVQDALHAHALLRRDVDYIIKEGQVESVDEFKGRIAQDRRWPAGLHTAVEVKEGVAVKSQGRVLGSITLQNLLSLYQHVCGMTGTAATQASEFAEIYKLPVEVIPTNRPMIRTDYADALFRTKYEKELAVLDEIRSAHETGRPVLVGTASVAESEQLSGLLADVPHQVLNARDEEREAAAVARAGDHGAVTISTNMAGRGTDIRLGQGVAELGGLHVVGTNRHEARRIDFQLRGRAGRQGDPGSSRFFVSMEDDIVQRYGEALGAQRLVATPESVQRVVEGKNLEIRLFLQKYEGLVEGQRQMFQKRRNEVLESDEPEFERLVALRTMDDLWSSHLTEVTELRSGIQWVAWGGRDPLHEFLRRVHDMYEDMLESLDDEIARRIDDARESGLDPTQRGATWTYLTTDNPFGSLSDRIRKGLVAKAKSLFS